jgi:hypothetical protein
MEERRNVRRKSSMGKLEKKKVYFLLTDTFL